MTERACRMLPFEPLRPLVHHHVMPCPGMGAHHSQASSSTSTSITCGPLPPAALGSPHTSVADGRLLMPNHWHGQVCEGRLAVTLVDTPPLELYRASRIASTT